MGEKTGKRNAFGVEIVYAKHVVPPTLKDDQASSLDIMQTKLPAYFQRKTDYDLEDGAPAGKWVGRFKSRNGVSHSVTILAIQKAAYDKPYWIVSVNYVRYDKPYSMQMKLVTGPLKPNEFSSYYPEMEQDIVNQEMLWTEQEKHAGLENEDAGGDGGRSDKEIRALDENGTDGSAI